MNTGGLHCIHEPDSVQRKTVGPGDSATPQATVPNLCSHLLQPSANPSLPASHTYVYIDASSRIPKQVSPTPVPNTPASGKEGLSLFQGLWDRHHLPARAPGKSTHNSAVAYNGIEYGQTACRTMVFAVLTGIKTFRLSSFCFAVVALISLGPSLGQDHVEAQPTPCLANVCFLVSQ